MAEQLYTIPVNDAFSADCECPLCLMARDLERNAIEFTMGPSYMEDDNREVTDKLGFCPKHIRMMYADKNKLGVALMLNTHMNKTNRELKALADKDSPLAKGLFSRKVDKSPVVRYIEELESNCFVCQRINPVFDRYVHTIFHMWKKDPEFKEKLSSSKGFCTYHYGILYDKGAEFLNQNQYAEFLQVLNKVYFENMERVNSDVSWFIDKHDYRNKEADWKNSKDSIPRAIIKTEHTIIEE
ncbi:MAG: hypothetical protein IKH94_08045 [Eubacterium sp.]|nr:hypothetical protein [Eubacterium sp.]